MKERSRQHHKNPTAKKGERRPRKTTPGPTRRLLLIDIENYCGKGNLQPADVRIARTEICRDLELGGGDLVVIGTSHSNNCFVCGTEWEGPRQVLRRGHDGADVALIDAFGEYRLDTFSSLVIVSGDGIFADIASCARNKEKAVTIVSRIEGLSGKLRETTNDVIPCVHVRPAA